MGSHQWTDKCPECGFSGMTVYSIDNTTFGADCPICGYRRWTEEDRPHPDDVEFAKKLLSEMGGEQIEQAVEAFGLDEVLLIVRERHLRQGQVTQET